MDIARLLVGAFDIFIGLLIVAIALPLAKGKVEMNRWYGVRVRQSFESPEKWDRINRYGGRQLVIWGSIIAALGGLAMLLDLGSRLELLAIFLLVPLLVLVPAATSVHYARNV